MATLTIRNLPEDLLERLKDVSRRKGRSMEQEVRDLLEARYPPRSVVLAEIRQSWQSLPPVSREEADAWRETGRR